MGLLNETPAAVLKSACTHLLSPRVSTSRTPCGAGGQQEPGAPLWGQGGTPVSQRRKSLVSPDSGERQAWLIAAAFPQQGVALVILGLKFAFKAAGSAQPGAARVRAMCGLVSPPCPVPVPLPHPGHTSPHTACPKGVPALPPAPNQAKIEGNKMEMQEVPAGTRSALLLLVKLRVW